MFSKTKGKSREFHLHGLRVLKPGHPGMRRLRSQGAPPVFGDRIWSSTWVLIDYLNSHGLADKTRILEIGCGWGLGGVYCAKNHRARVTCLDNDPEVFPYLKLLSEINRVQLKIRRMKIEDIEKSFLKDFDLVIGADICFSRNLVEPLKTLVSNSRSAGVNSIILADPGRNSFFTLAEHYGGQKGGLFKSWKITRPNRFIGYVLKLVFKT